MIGFAAGWNGHAVDTVPSSSVALVIFQCCPAGNKNNYLCPAVISKSCCTKTMHSISVFTSEWNIYLFLKKHSIHTYVLLLLYLIDKKQHYIQLQIQITLRNVIFFLLYQTQKMWINEQFFWAEMSKDILSYVFKGNIPK